jgi:hypothetical protein
MKKSLYWLSLAFVFSMFAQGCCWGDRPYLFPRLHWWRSGCCGTSCYLGAPVSDCGCAPVTNEHYFGTPIPMNPAPNPMMPGSTPLTRATFPLR